MLPDRVSNPGPLTYESGALLIALRGPARDHSGPVIFSSLLIWKGSLCLLYIELVSVLKSCFYIYSYFNVIVSVKKKTERNN